MSATTYVWILFLALLVASIAAHVPLLRRIIDGDKAGARSWLWTTTLIDAGLLVSVVLMWAAMS